MGLTPRFREVCPLCMSQSRPTGENTDVVGGLRVCDKTMDKAVVARLGPARPSETTAAWRWEQGRRCVTAVQPRVQRDAQRAPTT